jgi:hypothetical protein
MVVIAMSTVPWAARSAGTSAVHSADLTTTSSSPATTSYQYQPPSMNGLSGRSKLNRVTWSSSAISAETRCEWPLAIDL